MAIVEDEVRNESEEENEIEVVVEEYEGDDQDSDDSEDDDDDDDDAVDAALESKVADLELMLKADPYAYEDHVELVKAYWALSDLERWRTAFDRFIDLMALKPEHWLLRLRTEISLSHSSDAREKIAKLFEKAIEDGYSLEILSEWCSWCLGDGTVETTRQQLKRVVEIAGADPLSGKVFWDALFEYEKAQLDTFREDEHETDAYKKQKERVCRCLEEIVSRPLLHNKDAWALYEESAVCTASYGAEYVAGTLKDHKLALDFLEKITPFEDRLLISENQNDEKFRVYEEYIDTLENLCSSDFQSRDFEATLKTIYDRATTECPNLPMLRCYARHTRRHHSTASYNRALQVCSRRWPRTHHFWTLLMQQAERDGKDIDVVHAYFEAALLRGMETYKEGEQLWLNYIEYKRRQTDFEKQDEVERLRSTFRLAWDSLATCYGDEANDCEVPLYWARLEYQRMKSPKEGREVFEEIFKYGDNKTISKYWDALLRLELSRTSPMAENKLRDLFRRALKSVTDYPPSIANQWINYERDYGNVDTLVECTDIVEKKIIEWREYYKAMKDKMLGKKTKPSYKQDNKKNKFDSKNKNQPTKKQETTTQAAKKQDTKKQATKQQATKQQDTKKQADNEQENKIKGKRKCDGAEGSSQVKRKKEGEMEVDEPEKDSNSHGVKRSHDNDEEGKEGDGDIKRQKFDTEDARAMYREGCTLFVSNLEFKVNEQNLRDKLSQYGDIVSLRVRSGVKAFGGSICYCQYKNITSVDVALEHDRSTLDGRPMFFSRYSAKKTKTQFKYATSVEKNKLFVKNLPYTDCNKEELTAIFEPHGKLNDIRIVTHKDGRSKGLAYVDFEDEESAARAIEKTNGMLVGDRKIEVAVSAPPPKSSAPVSLGQSKRDGAVGKRRTQLSSFIPSVLLKATPSTSKAADTADAAKPKSNTDFRNLLLGNKQ